MADFSRMTSFLRKNLFFSHPELNFFQILKKQSCSTKTQDIPKKFAKQNFPRWPKMADIFKMAFVLFSCMKICLVTVILGLSSSFFGLSQYFLTFNHTKINFGFLDHPNMRLSYKILVNL
jgi:hypothetical protein